MSQAKPSVGPEVVVVHVVETINALSDLHKTSVREEIRGEVVAVAQVAKDVITQSEIQGQPRLDLPVVLSIEANRILNQVTVSVTECAIGIVGLAQQQLLDGILDRVAVRLKCSN